MRDDLEKATLCAANNADLYDAIFGANSLQCRRNSAFWSSDAVAPPYYSNLTTLDAALTRAQSDEISRLKSNLKRQFSLKDGFSRLELAAQGFNVLFSASWIWVEPGDVRPDLAAKWSRIRDAASLKLWEQSWKAGGSPLEGHIFTPNLLSDADIAVYGRSNGGIFDAGCIANRSRDVVGLSNIFNLNGTPSAAADALAAAIAFAPSLPVVGYEGDENLEEMVGLGFKPVGKLRIWISTDVA